MSDLKVDSVGKCSRCGYEGPGPRHECAWNREVVERYLTVDGPCTVVRGLPEEVTAMLFAFFSRNPRSLRETLISMLDEGHLEAPPSPPDPTSEKSRKFHERMTIGYGHKSVADHANVHWCLEGVSAVAERDFLSARLLAATSKSTRYVNFRDAGFVVPEEWPEDLRGEYEAHCTSLLDAYEGLIPTATSAIRSIMPYEGEVTEVWEREAGWEKATAKRALDMVRDLLPASIRTSFGVTNNATALREMLDKRQTDTECTPAEVASLAGHVRAASIGAVPTLVPEVPRSIPRHPRPQVQWTDDLNSFQRTSRQPSLRILMKPSWKMVQDVTGVPATDLIRRWISERGHHMVPDRTAEFATYVFEMAIPWAIQRDLGRHRIMTQTEGLVVPAMGYGADPLFSSAEIVARNPKLAMVIQGHQQALQAADTRISRWLTRVDPVGLQYASPLATMVPVKWLVSARELVHILGLRTTPQGHPSYRLVSQMVGTAIKRADPLMSGLVDEVTNFSDVLVGRPG